jgi:hypothetical protein
MRRFTLLVTFVALCVTVTPVRADADGHVNFLIGQKALDDDDTDPLDSGFAFGAIMSFGQEEWPVHIAVDALGYVDEEEEFDPFLGDVTLTGATFEAAVGVRKIWKIDNVRPYVGGGIGVVGAALEFDTAFGDTDADGNGFGPWIGGGTFWRLGERFNLGLDLRWNEAEVDLDFDGGGTLEDVNVGGLGYGLTVGFGW